MKLVRNYSQAIVDENGKFFRFINGENELDTISKVQASVFKPLGCVFITNINQLDKD